LVVVVLIVAAVDGDAVCFFSSAVSVSVAAAAIVFLWVRSPYRSRFRTLLQRQMSSSSLAYSVKLAAVVTDDASVKKISQSDQDVRRHRPESLRDFFQTVCLQTCNC